MIPPLDDAPDDLAPGVKARPGSLRFQYSRSSGPGGQNVNKVNTKVDLWVPLADILGMRPEAIERLRALAAGRVTAADEIHIVADGLRSQAQNRDDALARLRELIVASQVRPRPRKKTRPTKASRKRRLQAKRHRSEIKSSRRGESSGT